MVKTIEKECLIHGLTKHWFEGKGKNSRFRCSKCRTEAVQRRRLKLKLKAIEYKGGKCQICGYDKYYGALEFHHKDPTQKDFGISGNGITRAWSKVKKELDKCILICANCHREIHDQSNERINIKTEIRRCKFCGTKFETNIKGKKTFCSRKCLNIYRKAK